MSNETKQQLDAEFIQHVRELANEADQAREMSRQLGLDLPDEDDLEVEDVISDSILLETQNPEEAHRLYYGIRATLMNQMAPGEDFKELREEIYEEKNTYLNRGEKKDEEGIRGSDGRMGYLHNLRVVYRIVKEWERAGSNAWHIYCIFRKINEELDYHDEKYFSDKDLNEEIGDLFGRAWRHHSLVEE